MTRRKLPLILCIATVAAACAIVGIAQTATPAPAAFATPLNNDQSGAVSNGFTTNAVFAADEAIFMEEEDIGDGLGPVYNARSCVDCHAQPNVGGTSQVTELRVGHTDAGGNFVNPTITINDGANTIPNRSLINDRSICAQDSANVPGAETIRALRATTNVLGDGFVEAIDSNTLLGLPTHNRDRAAAKLPARLSRCLYQKRPGQVRAGRFGWKNQQASLLSFAADAYVNEQGVTSRLQPTETTTVCDTVADPEDHNDANGLADIDHFARFMRATQAPPVDAILAATADAKAGATLFNQIGCNICHVTSITTSPAGTVINGGAFTVPAALGSKIIHPYSDFLLHNVGTGRWCCAERWTGTANMMRTTPLWGGRTRDRLMHDLLTFTRNDAILRHAGEATGVINNYRSLSTTQKNQLITFLQSL